MPNGFHALEIDKWNQLEAPLLGIDDRLRTFARLRRLTIEKNYHAWPSRSLQWESDGLQRKIQIALANEDKNTYNLWLYASIGNQGPKSEFLKREVLFEEILSELDPLLEKAFSTIESWTQ